MYSEDPPPSEGASVDKLPWSCPFGDDEADADWCSFTQDESFTLQWQLQHRRATEADDTRRRKRREDIESELSTGNFAGVQVATAEPGSKAQLLSPFLTEFKTAKCLSFAFNIFGFDSGSLSVLDESFERFAGVRESEFKNNDPL